MALLVGAALSSHAVDAKACGACVCENHPEEQLPFDFLDAAPTNLKVPVFKLPGEAGGPRLEFAENGEVVATIVESAPTEVPFWLISAVSPLEPETRYRLARDDGALVAEFVTATQQDDAAPLLTSVEAAAGGNADRCGDTVGGTLRLEANSPADALLLVEIQVATESGTRSAYARYRESRIAFGSSADGCFGSAQIAGLKAGASYAAKVRLLDRAGNASAWRSVSVPSAADQTGGCGAAEAGCSASPTRNLDGTCCAYLIGAWSLIRGARRRSRARSSFRARRTLSAEK